MKKLKFAVAALLMGLGSLTFTGCKNDAPEANPLADSLQTENGSLNGKLNDKEAALQEFIASFKKCSLSNSNNLNPCNKSLIILIKIIKIKGR